MALPDNKTRRTDDYLLQPWEEFWVAHQPYLLQRGYSLRNRYDPNWIPSWYHNKKVKPHQCPDSKAIRAGKFLDGYRVSDRAKVGLKVVDINEDIPILEYLASPALLTDERNHTVPILDKFPVPGSENLVFIVMPYLLMFQAFTHPFRYVSEIVECVGQLLDGLEFMHDHGIAHRDACFFNLMVESTKLIPDGDVSILLQYKTDDWSRYIKPVVRRSVAPLKYFFIDFEMAVRYPPEEQNPLAIGRVGQERNVPELSDTVPYNPFKLDVYQLGSIFPYLFKDYDGMEFIEPLHEAMTLADPDKRPTSAQANKIFKDMISSLTEEDMLGRIWEKNVPKRFRRKLPKPQSSLLNKISRIFRLKNVTAQSL